RRRAGWGWLRPRQVDAAVDEVVGMLHQLLHVLGRHEPTHDQEALLVEGDIVLHADAVAWVRLERLRRHASRLRRGHRGCDGNIERSIWSAPRRLPCRLLAADPCGRRHRSLPSWPMAYLSCTLLPKYAIFGGR